jgi:RNA polymerase sigma-70 factor (ECF subfamily)
MLGSYEAAEDAVQEIFTKLYRAAGQYDSSKRFFSWLYTIALNYLRSQLRSPKKQARARTLTFDDGLQTLNTGDDLPERDVLRREAEEHLQHALQQLKPAYREVFLLRQMEELSVKETSRIMDIPENTVKTHFRRARRELRTILSQMGWK